MLYSDLFIKKEKKLPIFLAVFVLITIVGIFGYFFSSIKIPTRASSDYPRQIRVVNIGKNRAVIFWESSKKETGYILLGENKSNINKFYLDDQDTPSFKKPRFFHFITLNNLKEENVYYFKIVSNDKIFLNLENQPFSFQTLKKDSIIHSSKPLYGKIIDLNNIGVNNATLVFYGKDLPYFMTKTKSTGEWLIVLQREKKSFNNEETVNIEVYNEEGKKSFIRAKLKNLSPLKESIVLGKDYNFLNEENQVLSASSQIGNGIDSGLKLTVIYPQENALIPGRRPLIKGTALPLKNIDVILRSNEIYSFRTKSDNKGNWSLALGADLAPGDYQLEVISDDLKIKKIAIERRFKIAKSGETVLGEATPSATFAPTIAPTATAAPTATIVFSPTIYKTGSFNLPILLTFSVLGIVLGLFFILAF
jgi:hypothetical protein